MATTDSVTLTRVLLPYTRDNGTTGEVAIESIERAHDYATTFSHGVTYEAPRIESITYAVGQQVLVSAFGAWRAGTVVKVGRSRVTVDYARNSTGTRATRAFDAHTIRPA